MVESEVNDCRVIDELIGWFELAMQTVSESLWIKIKDVNHDDRKN